MGSRERTKKQENRGVASGSEGPGVVTPFGARLPPLARGRAEGAESHGEHQYLVAPFPDVAKTFENKRFFESSPLAWMTLCHSCANQPVFLLLFIPEPCRPFDLSTNFLSRAVTGDSPVFSADPRTFTPSINRNDSWSLLW